MAKGFKVHFHRFVISCMQSYMLKVIMLNLVILSLSYFLQPNQGIMSFVCVKNNRRKVAKYISIRF